MIRDRIWPRARLVLQLAFLNAVVLALVDAWGKISTFAWAALAIASVSAAIYVYSDKRRLRDGE